MGRRFASLLICIGLWSALLLPATAAAANDLPLELELPEGAGALILYSSGSRGSWWHDIEIWQGWQSLHRVKLQLHALPGDLVGTRRPADLRPRVLLLHPGEYVVSKMLQEHYRLLNSPPGYYELFEFSVAPGEVLIWESVQETPSQRQLDAADIRQLWHHVSHRFAIQPFTLREVSAEALARHMGRHSGLRPVHIDLFSPAVRETHVGHLKPLAMEPPLDARCLPGDRKLRWANAVAEAQLDGCAISGGRWLFDDGSRLQVVLNRDWRLGLYQHDHSTRVTQRRLSPLVEAEWLLRETDGANLRPVRDVFGFPGRFGLWFSTDALGPQNPDAQGEVHVAYATHYGSDGPRDNGRTLLPVARPGIPDWQHGPARLDYADGRVFLGSVRLLLADDTGQLPLPHPEGVGQRRYPDGRGVIARFLEGAAEGPAWCFDDFGGEPCDYRNDSRLSELGVPLRSVDTIMASLPPLPRQTAIDLLRRRHIEALLEERWEDFLQLEQDLLTLEVDTGLESLFYVARAMAKLGRDEPALARLNTYLNLAGSSGAAYADALALLDRLLGRQGQPASTAPDAAADARLERLGFCRSELQRGQPLCGCREFPELDLHGVTCS